MSKSAQEPLLGYLAWYKSSQSGYYGGILITNRKGVPVEFRHTSSVSPTTIQTLLYGDCLESGIGSDAMAPALVQALQHKPDILLIDTQGRRMFGRFVSEYPPAALLELLDDPDKAQTHSLYDGGDFLNAVALNHSGSASELLFAYLLDDADGNRQLCLSKAQSTMNLFSPFARIRDVLSIIDRKGLAQG